MGLYKYALELTNQTKMWEKSITICNKMLEIIQNRLYNYEEASCVLEWKSHFFTNINQDDRKFPNYYKINLVGIEYSSQNTKV